MSVTDEIKGKAAKKLDRIEKLFPENAEASVTFSADRNKTKIEVSVPLHKRVLRAEVSEYDVNAGIDAVVDILEKQMIKYKSRLRERRRRNTATNEELSFIDDGPEPEGNGDIVIQKTKRFALKPMDAHEAVMEMELLGHSFYVFRNDRTDEVNVVYKRSVGEYGLIEPQ